MNQIEDLQKLLSGEYKNFATPKKINRSEISLPQDFVDEVEKGNVSVVELLELQATYPIYVYRTCITIHGSWPELSRQRIGGYKNLIQNANGSVEVLYSALDADKKNFVANALRYTTPRLNEIGISHASLKQDSKGHTISFYFKSLEALKQNYQEVIEFKEKVLTTVIGRFQLVGSQWLNMYMLELDLLGVLDLDRLLDYLSGGKGELVTAQVEQAREEARNKHLAYLDELQKAKDLKNARASYSTTNPAHLEMARLGKLLTDSYRYIDYSTHAKDDIFAEYKIVTSWLEDKAEVHEYTLYLYVLKYIGHKKLREDTKNVDYDFAYERIVLGTYSTIPTEEQFINDAKIPDYDSIKARFEGKTGVRYGKIDDPEKEYKIVSLKGRALAGTLRLSLKPITLHTKQASSEVGTRSGVGALGQITHVTDTQAGPINLLDYSSTSIVVYGLGTKAIKDTLKANYNAFWNSRLTYKSEPIMGWVINKKHTDAVISSLFS